MGQKDISEKILLAYNDVFADIVNVLLFDGEEVIKIDELEEQSPRYAYKADGKSREIERDVAKRWKKGNIRIACIGIENQTHSDADMPLRIIGYDGAEYRTQLNDTAHSERYPVITLVLYFGYEKHWDMPLSLYERLDISEKFKPYVNDYRVNLFEIAYLDEEKIKLFKSDFKIVADFFSQMQRNGNYNPSSDTIKHVQEVLNLLSVMTGNKNFDEVYNRSSKGEINNMCKVVEQILEQGREQGRMQGLEQGRIQGREQGMEAAKRDMAISLYRQGIPNLIIAGAANVSLDTLKKWIAESQN